MNQGKGFKTISQPFSAFLIQY